VSSILSEIKDVLDVLVERVYNNGMSKGGEVNV
jgi:hypothetical protein